MNVPNLPTDNLYKFVSLTGVLLALLCFGGLEYRLSKQMELDLEIRLGKESLGYLRSDIHRSLAHNKAVLDLFNEKLAKVNLTEYSSASKELDERRQLQNQWNDIDGEVTTLTKKAEITRDHSIREGRALRKKSDFADIYLRRTMRVGLILLSGGLAGIVLAAFGFWCWYHRLQKYQDILLIRQALDCLEKTRETLEKGAKRGQQRSVTNNDDGAKS